MAKSPKAFLAKESGKLEYQGQKQSLKDLHAKTENQDALPGRWNLVFEDGVLEFRFDAELQAFLDSQSKALDTIQATLAALPDRKILWQALVQKSQDSWRLSALTLSQSRQLVLVDGPLLGVQSSLLASHPSLSLMLIGVGLIRALRTHCLGAEKAQSVNKDLGTALILLATNQQAREHVRADTCEAWAKTLFADGDPFVALLVESLRKHPLKPVKSKPKPEDNIFFDPKRFDRLPLTAKLKVVLAGQLAWYSSLSLGLLWLLRGLWDRWPGYYSEAREALHHDLGKGMFKRKLGARIWREAQRGRLLKGLEYFWSAWNPSLTRIAIRPFFRMLGGNRRPFLATLCTFMFSALVVHLMLWTSLILALCWQYREQSETAAWLASPRNISVQLGILVVYFAIGVIIGGLKSLRRRRD